MAVLDVQDWINAKLKERGIRDEAELCRLSGIESGTLSTAKKRNSIGPDLAMKLAKGLQMSQADVFYELGIMTEKPGEPVLVDPILADIWRLLDGMSERERIAAQVMLERWFGGAESGDEPDGEGRVTARRKNR